MTEKKQKPVGIEAEETYTLESMHTHCVSIKHREIWIHGTPLDVDQSYEGIEPGVEYMMATRVIKNLHILRHQSPTEPVLVHLHTCGGIYQEGMAIYNTAKSMPYPITMLSYTHARSMSSIILQAADRRVLMPDSYFMFHYGSAGFYGEAKTYQSNAEFDKIGDKTMVDIYVSVAKNGKRFQGWTENRIRNHITSQMDRKSDVFLVPEEAVAWGFADEIFNGDWNGLKKFESK